MKKIAIAEAEKDQREAALIVTMRELKAYRRLRDEQYARHVKATRDEEEKEISDLVSHNAASR
jgi:hypothetical protein